MLRIIEIKQTDDDDDEELGEVLVHFAVPEVGVVCIMRFVICTYAD